MNPTTNYRGERDLEHESSREIHDDIRHTRTQMDETIDKLGEKLNPRNILDDLLDVFRSDSSKSAGQQIAGTVKSTTGTVAEVVRRHPMPSLLIAAGAIWWMCEQGEEEDRPRLRSRRVYDYDYDLDDEDFDEAYAASTLGDVPAWDASYDWTRSGETESAWNERADRTLKDLTTGDEAGQASQRIRGTAASLVSLSGYNRQDIGSRYVTSQRSAGYTDLSNEDYPRHWEHLAAADAIASDYESDDESLSEKASAAWESIKSTLGDATRSTKDRLKDAAAAISEYASQTGRATASAGSSVAGAAASVGGAVRGGASAAGRATARSARAVAGGARATGRGLYSGARSTGRGVYSGARATGRGLSSGYDYTRQGVSAGYERTRDGLSYGYERTREGVVEAADEYPLAVGAACFGIGLLAGLIMPRTRYEDDLLGERSDELKDSATEAAKEAANRGKQVASATAKAAMHEAEELGLTPEQLRENARGAAASVKTAVQTAVSKQAKELADKGSHFVEDVTEAAHHVADKAKSETAKQAKDLTGSQAGQGSGQSKPSGSTQGSSPGGAQRGVSGGGI